MDGRLRLEGQGHATKLRGLKITDFGVSRYLNNPHSAEVERGMTQAMGTTGYISPEMAVGMRLAQDQLWLKSDGARYNLDSCWACHVADISTPLRAHSVELWCDHQ
jgi:serine/threonine protein kinase